MINNKDDLISVLCDLDTLCVDTDSYEPFYYLVESNEFPLTTNELETMYNRYVVLREEKGSELTDTELSNIAYNI